jgi:hypothetical protein
MFLTVPKPSDPRLLSISLTEISSPSPSDIAFSETVLCNRGSIGLTASLALDSPVFFNLGSFIGPSDKALGLGLGSACLPHGNEPAGHMGFPHPADPRTFTSGLTVPPMNKWNNEPAIINSRPGDAEQINSIKNWVWLVYGV